MSKHLQRDLENLKRDLLAMGSMVWDAIQRAMTALVDRRPELAAELLEVDDAIDAREVEIEEECLKLLALHQPVATDLRYIITVLKVNNDLERIGDLAVNIAERAVDLASDDPIPVALEFGGMVERVQAMVNGALDALVERDTELARRVLAMDDEVDALHRAMFATLQDVMREDPATVVRAVQSLSVSRHLERIADLATNIAEDVVFMVDGDLIRHQHELDGTADRP